MRYTLSLIPHANQRYAASVRSLSAAELTLLSPRLSSMPSDIEEARLGRGDALRFSIERLTCEDVSALYALSSALSLFEGEDQLSPIAFEDVGFVGDDIAGVLKYKGKTNEVFTNLLLNLAWVAWDRPGAPHVLDPLCGRGTTIYQALRRGWDATGLDIDAADIREACAYLKRYLERGRYKHTVEDRGFSLDGRKAGSCRRFTIARDTAAMKSGDSRSVEFAQCDARNADRLFKKASFDLVIADLPYGVQHAGEGDRKKPPEALLREALPAWTALLRSGGIAAFSFNTHTLPRLTALDIAMQSGLTPLTGGAHEQLQHWVEQAVIRDIVVAVKA